MYKQNLYLVYIATLVLKQVTFDVCKNAIINVIKNQDANYLNLFEVIKVI